MEIRDSRAGAQPQVQTTSLPVSPTPGASPWGGQAPPQPIQPPPTQWVQPAPGVQLDPRTGNQIIDATKPPQPTGPYVDVALVQKHALDPNDPGGEARPEARIAWALQNYPASDVENWWRAHLAPGVFPKIVEAFNVARKPPQPQQPQQPAQQELHPSTRTILEGIIRQGASDEQILAQYAHVPQITKDALAQLRYAMAVPTAQVTLPPALAQPPAAGAPPPPPQPQTPPQSQESDAGKPQRWSKARRDKAIEMFRAGASDAQVAAETSMALDKVAEYRAELQASTQAAAPQNAQPRPTPTAVELLQPGSAPIPVVLGPIIGVDGWLSTDEMEALMRLFRRAQMIIDHTDFPTRNAIDAQYEDAMAALDVATPTLPEHEVLARRASLRLTRDQAYAQLKSWPAALARAVEEAQAEVRAFSKFAAIMPR